LAAFSFQQQEEAVENSTLAIIITLITAVTFALLGVLYVSRHRLSLEEYIVHRNSTGSWLALATVVASVAGAWILFSPAETGVRTGLAALIGYGVGQAAPLAAFAAMGPRMRRLMPQGHSITEYVWHRFGPAMYLFALGVMVFYMFVFLAAELTGIALALQLVAGTPLVWTALIVAIGTVIYTAYGGLRASIFTDGIQFLLIIPLLLVVFLAAALALGGFSAAFGPVSQSAPQLLSLTHRPGIEFGVTLIIAVLAANMFHQGFWQRVYTCRDDSTLRKAFYAGGLVIIPIIFIGGLFGIMAVGFGVPAEQASVALFSLVVQILPTWTIVLLLILALVLVMSSMDTLLNGIASAVTSDLPRFWPGVQPPQLLNSSRLLTVLVAVPAVIIAAQGYSVLYLFLIADLVCAGAVFPVFYGLYSRHLSGLAALTSCVAGIVVGALFFPRPDFSPWLNIPQGGNFLVSFGAALGVSVVIAVLWSVLASRLPRSATYDFQRLQEQVRVIQG
jgi:Na+/proline symporter